MQSFLAKTKGYHPPFAVAVEKKREGCPGLEVDDLGLEMRP